MKLYNFLIPALVVLIVIPAIVRAEFNCQLTRLRSIVGNRALITQIPKKMILQVGEKSSNYINYGYYSGLGEAKLKADGECNSQQVCVFYGRLDIWATADDGSFGLASSREATLRGSGSMDFTISNSHFIRVTCRQTK